IQLAKDLSFDSFEYGWNLNVDDEASKDALIVDCYLNVNEALFDADSIFALMKSSGLHAFATFGLTLGPHGCLFDTRLIPTTAGPLQTTPMVSRLTSPLAQDAYRSFSLAEKYRLVDRFFQPGGYTLVGFKAGAVRRFAPDSRILTNALVTANV